jgi:hypothetical protein
MPIATTLINRISAAISSVGPSTDLDLLVSYLDVGQRGTVDITPVVNEITRRANLVDANTSYLDAAKLTAAMFKIDNPAPALWSAGGSSEGGPVGEIISGHFLGNPKYVSCNGSRYRVAAYPEMAPIVAAGAIERTTEPTAIVPRSGRINETVSGIDCRFFVDGDVVMIPQQNTSASNDYHLLDVSTDGGVNWVSTFYRPGINSSSMPEAPSSFHGSSTQQVMIVDIVKLDSPGHYSALLISSISTSSSSFAMVTTTDFGMTWSRWINFPGVNYNAQNPNAIRLFYRNGVYLCLSVDYCSYSTNFGQTWVALSTTSTWRPSNAMLRRLELSTDGILAYASGRNVLHFTWPATAAGWNANLNFTTRTNALSANASAIRRCGNIWMAWDAGNAGSAIWTTTNVSNASWAGYSLTGISIIHDLVEMGSNLYILAEATGQARNIFTTPLQAVLSSAVTSLLHVDIPDVNASTTFGRQWSFPSVLFGKILGVANGAYFKLGRSGVSRYNAITGATRLQHIRPDTPQLGNNQFCRKYGQWFTSIMPFEQTVNEAGSRYSSYVFGYSGAPVMHYRSTDARNWIPIGLGVGHIVDGGDRLVRFLPNGTIRVSTDGIVWNSTGVTQPTGMPTVGWGRLWRVHNRIFLCAAVDSISTTVGFWSSGNGGLTWQQNTGLQHPLSTAYIPAGIAFFEGAYHCIGSYADFDPTALGSYNTAVIQRSVDGFTWTTTYTASMTGGSIRFDEMGLFIRGGRLTALAGAKNVNGPGTNAAVLWSTSGLSWTLRDGSDLISANWIHVDTSNGEQKYSFTQSAFIVNQSMIRLRVIRNGVEIPGPVVTPGAEWQLPRALSGAGDDLMGVTSQHFPIYSSASLAFIAHYPTMTGSDPLPFLRVAK